jgi:hypothetical protein
VSLLEASREEIIRESTDIAFLQDDNPIARRDVEQMIRACVALIEEGLRGESREVRSNFLEALPDVAKSTTWELTLKNGIPCWGVILGKLVAEASPEHRAEATRLLAEFMGQWWADVSKVMLPVFLAEGTV